MKFYDFKEVKAAANGGWAGLLGGLGVDTSCLTGRHTRCPGCGGKDRFRFDDKDGDGTWICSGGGNMQSGDGIALLAHVRGIEWKEAVNLCGEALGMVWKEFEKRGNYESGVATKPVARVDPVNELYDHLTLKKAVAGVEKVTPEWFMERSPVDVRGLSSGEFLNTVFEPGERALIFTNFYSQGDFAWEVGKGGFRLGDDRGVRAVKSALPVNGGKDGVWFLSNPVTLGWEANPRRANESEVPYSRRTKECVTSWRYLVLECDESKTLKKRSGVLRDAIREGWKPGPATEEKFKKLGKEWAAEMMSREGEWDALARQYADWAGEVPGMWLKFLAIFPNSIRAIYSSGGESWHALVHVGMETWADMDGLLKGNPRAGSTSGRLGAKRVWSKLGADPGALSPVRLTRLPGCTRNGNEQRLIYLNDGAQALIDTGNGLTRKRIVDLVPRRKLT
jgi:hypothetical protein